MIAEGRHPAKVIALAFGAAKTGTEQIALQFEILDGRDRGSTISWYGALTEKAWEWTLKALAACGWPPGVQLDGLGVSHLQSLVSLVIEHESGQDDKLRARVRWINRPGGGNLTMREPIEGASLRQLAAKWSTHAEQIERYDPIPIPEFSRAPEDENQDAASERKSDHPNAPGNSWGDGKADDDIPF